MNILGALLIVFITLKLLGLVTWSWWIVLVPFWIWLGLVVLVITLELWVDARGGDTRRNRRRGF